MATDKKDTALTENTAPLGSDLMRMVDDPGGTPLSQKLYMGGFNLLPDGFMVNGKLSVTVASNNLTVALKTKSGGDPSATDPVSVWINGTYRRCTAALSVTKNAATNWCNAGGAELATIETDYFVYLVWNTTPATDIMDIGFARIPSGRVYSDFSATTTNERYLAYGNASAPTSTDDCVVVGRFAATLSAGAGYTWSVPTFTSKNLLHTPTDKTRWLTWAPVQTGFSSNPTNGSYRYKTIMDTTFLEVMQAGDGTSNATTFTMTLPFTATTSTNAVWGACMTTTRDNTALLTTPGRAFIASGGSIVTLQKDTAATAWTNSGGKRAGFELFYEI